MGWTNFPHGVTSLGIPQVGSGGIPVTLGDYFFVDSGTGSASNPGTDPANPLATFNSAIGKCTANNGDVIVVLPGHTETIASATTLVPNVAGITIVGLGKGSLVPTLTFSATGSEIEIGADNITIENIRFHAGVSAVATGVDVNANHCTIKDCVFYYGGTTTYDFVQAIDVDAYDDCQIIGCKFYAENATAGADQHIRLDDAHRTRIIGCEFYGDCADAAIIGEGAASLSILIAHNIIYNDDTSAATNGIHLGVACTGMIAYNSVTGLYATAPAAIIDPGSCGCIENYVSNAIDESGTIVPITLSST
jgi:hypothetical protein